MEEFEARQPLEPDATDGPENWIGMEIQMPLILALSLRSGVDIEDEQPSRFEGAMELAQGGGRVRHMDHDVACRHQVKRFGRQLLLIEIIEFGREVSVGEAPACEFQQRRGDVRQGNLPAQLAEEEAGRPGTGAEIEVPSGLDAGQAFRDHDALGGLATVILLGMVPDGVEDPALRRVVEVTQSFG